MAVAAIALAYAGFTALSLAMDRHHADVYGRGKEPSPRARQWLRAGGAAGLALSLLACVERQGWNMGPILWCGAMTLGALLLSGLLLPYAPRWAVRLAMVSAPIGLISLALAR
ncbi:MAG TPA: DUF3325 domain-containing protein [Candidatus Aquabacterium excrementipullorum]|nr:DUF3325 domain-containing protein [Candidatus Aquabacterium excrementipullorum]